VPPSRFLALAVVPAVNSILTSMNDLAHLPLAHGFGDADAGRIFSLSATVAAWLAVERAIAVAQGELGIIPQEAAEAIGREAHPDKIDLDALAEGTRVVGYPILPLLEQLTATCSPAVGSFLHWGITTQDIVDSGRSLQVRDALERVESHLLALGDALASASVEQRASLIVGRTHAQHAVPTTLGAKLAVWLAETTRHLARLRAVRPRVAQISLFGAGGTNAALGTLGPRVRRRTAELLGLTNADVPWHVARDGLAELAFVLGAASATCVKIAREIIDLSRPEIDELREQSGHLRGASSTMPQKANPVASEAIVGLGLSAEALVAQLLHAMHGGHERSAGEWQSEWDAVPLVFVYASGALARTAETIGSLNLLRETMTARVDDPASLIMAESLMISLAPALGRARAHDVVYRACARARTRHEVLGAAVTAVLADEGLDVEVPHDALDPSRYLGEVESIVDTAVEAWQALRG
jgi:3-carboxy-cis,cis-muconate cycloisomerase